MTWRNYLSAALFLVYLAATYLTAYAIVGATHGNG
jgi:hypothetical protein